jgi:hypothetical protein
MIKALVAGVAVTAGLFAFVDYAFSIPDVHVSYATSSCVEVVNYPSALFGTSDFSCENMPTKFNHIWVK